MAYLFGVSEPEKLVGKSPYDRLVCRLPNERLVVAAAFVKGDPKIFSHAESAEAEAEKRLFPQKGLQGFKPVYLGESDTGICELGPETAQDLGIHHSNGERQSALDDWSRRTQELQMIAIRLNIQYGAFKYVQPECLPSSYIKHDFHPLQRSFSGSVLYRVSKDNWRLRLIVRNGVIHGGRAFPVYACLLGWPSEIKSVTEALQAATGQALPFVTQDNLPNNPYVAVLERINAIALTKIGVVRIYPFSYQGEKATRLRQYAISIRKTPKSAVPASRAILLDHLFSPMREDERRHRVFGADKKNLDLAPLLPSLSVVLRTR
ncbi:MAG: hypothetical protein AB7G80_01200 [Dongiaceae bacterium]